MHLDCFAFFWPMSSRTSIALGWPEIENFGVNAPGPRDDLDPFKPNYRADSVTIVWICKTIGPAVP